MSAEALSEVGSPAAELPSLSEDDRRWLLDLADESIRSGLDGGGPPEVELTRLSSVLREPRGVFVTVTVAGGLNGCVGTIDSGEPLARSVARLAWAAAFDDPRLPAMTVEDYGSAAIEISVLGPLHAIPATSLDRLLSELTPVTDGLVLGCRGASATFLPAVWESLPDPTEFVLRLLEKAGLPCAPWPTGLKARRYTVEHFGRRCMPGAG